MEFWQDHFCTHCGGVIEERNVVLHRTIEGKHILIENIPAGVCTVCSTRFYTSTIINPIEEVIRENPSMLRETLVSVYSLMPDHARPSLNHHLDDVVK